MISEQRILRTFGPLAKDLLVQTISPERVLCTREDQPFSGEHAMYCIGTFDGVHTGHSYLVQQAKTWGEASGLPCVALTFNPRPQDVLSPGLKSFLTTRVAAVNYLLAAGADAVIVQTFSQEFSHVNYADFIASLQQSLPHMEGLLVGENLKIGYKRAGDKNTIAEFANEHNLPFYPTPLLEVAGQAVSSSRIRVALSAGEIERAEELLGRDFFVEGEVIRGKGKGKKFGFATANIAIDDMSAMVPDGVYAGYAQVDTRVFPAAINVGFPPSFEAPQSDKQHFLEAHLLGFDEDMYGQNVRIAFVQELRDSRVFKSIESLKEQVVQNIQDVSRLIGPGELYRFS